MNASLTATDNISSCGNPGAQCRSETTSRSIRDGARTMVKRSRDQSSDEPSRRSCEQIVFPYCSFHVNTSFRNASRPSSWRVTPRSRASFFSTTVCVAIPAWSVPAARAQRRSADAHALQAGVHTTHTRHPQRLISAHAPPAHDRVLLAHGSYAHVSSACVTCGAITAARCLDAVRQRVADVQGTRDVRWGNDDHKLGL